MKMAFAKAEPLNEPSKMAAECSPVRKPGIKSAKMTKPA